MVRQGVARGSLSVGTIVVLIVVWELAVQTFNVYSFILPAPTSIFAAMLEFTALIARHTGVTLYEVGASFLLAIAVGVPLAILIATSALIKDAIYPIIVLLQSVPKVAVAPVLLVAFGYGELPKILVGFLVAFFPIVVNTASGLESTPRELIHLSKSLSASRIDVFRRFRFPYALPMIFVGFKLAITLAVIGAVIGEFVGSSAGLGYLILISSSTGRTPLTFAAIIILGVMSILLFYAVVALERWLVPWAGHGR